MKDHDIAAAIAALSAEYGSRLPEKYQEMAAAVQKAQQGVPEALEEALHLAHRLHGTAGSYGFVQVSAAAGQVEKLLRQLREGGGAWDGVHTALQEVQAASNAHAHPTEATHTVPGTVLGVDDEPA